MQDSRGHRYLYKALPAHFYVSLAQSIPKLFIWPPLLQDSTAQMGDEKKKKNGNSWIFLEKTKPNQNETKYKKNTQKAANNSHAVALLIPVRTLHK